MLGESLFRSFHRDSRYLTDHLTDRFLKPIQRQIQGMDLAELSAKSADQIALDLINGVRITPPALGGTERASVREHEGGRRASDPTSSIRVATTRFYVAIEVIGEYELLEWWPNEEDPSGLVPVDLLPQPDPNDSVRAHLAAHRDEQWRLEHREDPGRVALFTFVDLTPDEVYLVEAGTLSPKTIVDGERRHIEPIVAAIQRQTNRFFDQDLVSYVHEFVEQRIRRLRALDAVAGDLAWPEGFRFAAPQVEETDPKPQAIDAGTEAEVTVKFRSRLASVTFDDMMRTVRIWGSGVERYPDAFGALAEERLSDLLAATLNAALPGAQREVYTRGGKSDLFVHADAIDTGHAHARVFIGECKWWDGPQTVEDAFGQLWGYLEVKDTYGLLLLFSRNVDGERVRASALERMTSLEAVPTESSPVHDWPYVRIARGGRNVTLCVAVLDLAPPKAPTGQTDS